MSDPDLVQRFTPPRDCRLLSMNALSDNQAGVRIRELYKIFKPKHPENLDFTVSLRVVASFPDTLGWDLQQSLEDLPRIWRASRRAGRFILIITGGGGSCLIAEILGPDEDLNADTTVRVHPHPLHLPINKSLKLNGIHFAIAAGSRKDQGNISICADPGTGADGAFRPSPPQPGPEITLEQEKKRYSAPLTRRSLPGVKYSPQPVWKTGPVRPDGRPSFVATLSQARI